jgi:hypothetical protein
MNELLLSGDEIDLIWYLPYITEQDRLEAIIQAQLDAIWEELFPERGVCHSGRHLAPAVAATGT